MCPSLVKPGEVMAHTVTIHLPGPFLAWGVGTVIEIIPVIDTFFMGPDQDQVITHTLPGFFIIVYYNFFYPFCRMFTV